MGGVITAAAYVEMRRRERPQGVTLAEFDEFYPKEHLIDEWREQLFKMFRESDEQITIALIHSIEKHCEKPMVFLQQMEKFYPKKMIPNWWTYLKCWREMPSKSK